MEKSQAASQRLSCRRCQTRKIKCDRKYPCSNCIYHKINCEYRTQDGRRRPASHAYIAALETRVASYETLIHRLKDAKPLERDAILDEVTLDDHLGTQEQPPAQASAENPQPADQSSPAVPIGSLKQDASGALQYHGPTSVYLDEGLDDPPPLGPSRDVSSAHSWSDCRLATALGIDNALVNESLALFFTYQYPQFMFVYREAFLSDYFTFEHGGKYWSFSLLYALCALGAGHSPNPQTRSKSSLLAKCAYEIILTHELRRPTFTTVQALLCLGFHKLGCGSSSEGWLLSGMAFRMGQDLGFHRDPRLWMSKDSSILTQSDIEIRRRIYWGCYLADKFISLYLGRPVSLMERDAEVEPVEPLPDFPDDHGWFGLGDISANFSSNIGGRPHLTLGFQHMVVLGGILQDIMAIIFSPKCRSDQFSMLNRLGHFNLRLNRWHSELPDSLQWNQWSQKPSVEPHILVLHLFYHSIMLSLNRHFIATSKHPGFSPNQQSQDACAASCDVVVAMARQVHNQPTISKPPVALIYALTMVAITIITTSGREGSQHDARFAFIIKALAEWTAYFSLAGEMRLKLVRYLQMPTPTAKSSSETRALSHIDQRGPSFRLPEQVSSTEAEGQTTQQSPAPPSVSGEQVQLAIAAPSVSFVDSPNLQGFGQTEQSLLSDTFQDWVFQSWSSDLGSI